MYMRGNWPVLIASVIDTTSPVACCRMQEDSADALASYPGSHLDSVAEFLVGQYQKDAVGPMLGSSGSSATSGEQPAAIPAAAAAAEAMCAPFTAATAANGRLWCCSCRQAVV